MTARTTRRLGSAFWITGVCVIVSMTYETLSDGRPTIIGFSIGLGLGVFLALLEESSFSEPMGRLQATVALANRRQHYLDRYGVAPEYRAGAHCEEQPMGAPNS